MKITRCTLSQEHWYCCTRKPTICPYCGEKAVRKSIFGYPSPELFYSKKYHLQGCMPDFPRPRDWGCVSCDAAFFKESEAVVDYMAQTYKETDDQVDDWFEVAREKVANYRANERFTDINVPYKEPDPVND